ncbi:hypothetical protein GGR53DRAFT_478296 [Hypoxylon sp. FL1150]|nr:hypothetical protein GGR53DRAFT_478296 [Hypoxylon sp. FL1150]
MAQYYNSRHWSHEHDYNRNLASRFSRDARHSSYPTINIVNEGKLVVDERTLRNTNAVIYNSERATLRLSAPKPTANPFAPEVYHYNSYYYPQQAATWWGPSGLPIHTCRSCRQRREIYYAGYCHYCAAIRYSAPNQRVHDDRRVAFAQQRQLGWR